MKRNYNKALSGFYKFLDANDAKEKLGEDVFQALLDHAINLAYSLATDITEAANHELTTRGHYDYWKDTKDDLK